MVAVKSCCFSFSRMGDSRLKFPYTVANSLYIKDVPYQARAMLALALAHTNFRSLYANTRTSSGDANDHSNSRNLTAVMGDGCAALVASDLGSAADFSVGTLYLSSTFILWWCSFLCSQLLAWSARLPPGSLYMVPLGRSSLCYD